MAPPTKCSLFFTVLILTIVLLSAEWITAPRRLVENHDYTTLEQIAKIRSDKANFTKILYFLSGPGVDEEPKNVFGIDQNTGFVRVYSILDREKIARYQLQGIAKYTNFALAEKNIVLNITVVDVNDCTPVIKMQQVGSVSEASAARTVVMKVIATDDDDENTLNSKIFYSIDGRSNSAGMFSINPLTGEVFLQRNTLDRETKDTYKLIIKASDLGGRAGGNTGTGEITINIMDINDNVPTLEKESYVGSVQENTMHVEVLRIKAVDLDLIYTDNWLAVFKFVSGNEAGFFNITTDPKTNEGIIMIHQALDYEVMKVFNLTVAVSNKAEYNFGSSSVSGGGSITQKYYPITINVVNQNEGPRFNPVVKVVTVSEGQTSINLNQIITTYAAIDTDTSKIATNVRYTKFQDIDNWLIVDERTADIRLRKFPDRESKYLVNGTYYVIITCNTNEVPSKTATGTIAIQVEDFNDHCPTLTSTTHTMCYEDNFIYVTAIDQDQFPNSAPFQFTVVEGTSWSIEPLNETTVILRDQARLWPGIHKVTMEIKDQQGKSCADIQTMDVVVCTCDENTKTCVPRSNVTRTFGAAGVLLLLLGLLLLLLVPLLLLFCLCGGAAALENMKPIPYDTKQQLISYHTEGQGEDKAIPLIDPPVEVEHHIDVTDIPRFAGKRVPGGHHELGGGPGGMTTESRHLYSRYQEQHGHGDYVGGGMVTGQKRFSSQSKFGAFDGMALSDDFLGEYYISKSNHTAQQAQPKDSMLVYDFEGRGSPTGSVGCCSLLENDNDLSFLNDLGPKFKTLAEICRGSALVTESVNTRVSIPPPRPASPVRPSTSSHTHVQTHSESIRDRDHTFNASNITPGSSTMIQEETITERSHGLATVQDRIMVPSQTVLVQQPTMYYTAQPMYVVEPKPQVVFVAGGAQQAVGQVGLSQGMVQVSGLQAPQGMILVDSQGGGSTTRASQGTVTRQILVENGSSGGERVAQVSKSFVQTRRGLAGQGLEVSGQGRQVKSSGKSVASRGFVSLNDDIARLTTPKSQGSQKVVVQHKKVSVTERNIE